MPYKLSMTVFTQTNFVADFLQAKCDFTKKRPFCVVEPLWGLRGTTYDDHLRLIGKRVVDFLLVLIELFSLGVTAEALRANIGSKSAISLQRGPVDPKFQVEGVAPTNHGLSHNIKIWTDLFPFCQLSYSAFDRRTDGQTLVRACIPCSAVTRKKNFFLLHVSQRWRHVNWPSTNGCYLGLVVFATVL